jgi:primosomal replication protein N''
MSEKICPSCEARRPSSEVFCQNVVGTLPCGWDLTGVAIEIATTGAAPAPPPPKSPPQPRCVQGHAVRPGDFMCPECGGDIATPAPGSAAPPASGFGESEQLPYDPGQAAHETAAGPASTQTPEPELPRIGTWSLAVRIGSEHGATATWQVHRDDGEGHTRALLVHYPRGLRSDPGIASATRALAPRVANVMERGEHEERPYAVYETAGRRTLREAMQQEITPDRLNALIAGIAGTLGEMNRVGLRHRDVRPEAIVIDGNDCAGVGICRLGAARLSMHDFDTAPPPEITRYTAPEILAGAVTPASDWWSLGIIVLELVTRGAAFDGIDDQAFLMHVVARGVEIPEAVPADFKPLLQGLLAKDRDERWQAKEVEAWLAGKPVALPQVSTSPGPSVENADTLTLSGRTYRSVSAYAFAAARKESWQEAREQLIGGRLALWLEGFSTGERMRAGIRNIVRREELDDDTKLGLALKQLDPDMPLVRAGEIVTPAWLLQHPVDGYALITGPAPDLLQQQGAESWLVRLKRRAAELRRRLEAQEIEVDEASLRINLLSTSARQLALMWDEQRRMLPDSEHRGLAALMERSTLREEDFIILLSAAKGQFVPLTEAVAAASQLARREGITSFDEGAVCALLQLPRREILAQLDACIEGFARSGRERIDQWVDQYRLERRIPLMRAVVVLSLPAAAWTKPPRQDYVAQLLGHFEKRIGTSVSRGPLARMTISKSSARIDLTELGTRRARATALLDHILERTDAPVDIDPAAFDGAPQLEQRLRRLVRDADLQRRETGINGLNLGFPFVLMRPRGEETKPRIAPVLLWPVSIHAEVGQRARFRLAFDRDREEVRLNPALQNMLAPDALQKWQAARDDILAGVTTATAVMDELQMLADKVLEASLCPLPGADMKVASDKIEMTSAAVLFHVTFVGQAIVNDIHQLQSIPPTGSGLETLLRSAAEQAEPAATRGVAAPEIDRYVTADSDPAQDRAVARARLGPGLVIEGPPGTGKSQTIVNLVADAIGRKSSLLIVCQKQAALDVVCKRLEREGLGERIVMVTDPTKDRRAVLEQIRSQLDHLRANGHIGPTWQRQRAAVLERITRLEEQLNTRHDAHLRRDEISGKTYQELLAELIEIEADGAFPDVVALRSLLASTSAEEADLVAEQCGALASLWRSARYEESALHALKPFGIEPGTIERCLRDIEAFGMAERRRIEMIDERSLAIEVTDAAALTLWATQNASTFVKLGTSECAELGRFVTALEQPGGRSAVETLVELRSELTELRVPRIDARMAALLTDQGDLELDGWIALAVDALEPRNWFSRLLGGGKAARRKLEALLAPISPVIGDSLIRAFLDSASHERELRGLKSRLDDVKRATGAADSAGESARLSRGGLLDETGSLARSLERAARLYEMLASAPCRRDAIAAAAKGTPDALATLFDGITRALAHDSAKRASHGALDRLTTWLEPAWIDRSRDRIAAAQSNVSSLALLVGGLPTIEAFQRFRARAQHLSPLALSAFASLRPIDGDLDPTASSTTGNVVTRIIRREARLGWKQRLEAAEPMLTAEETEVASHVRALAAAEEELKRINREALAGNIEPSRLGDRASWDDITRFTGPRSRRLREFLQMGAEIGLMELRPVWLMGPDVASRLLPLERNLFDTIVYDEASQMPVEYALPTLYRARTVVVSGDEKQLPPTSFFATRTTREDDTDDIDGAPDDLDGEQRLVAEEAWNRREIQDCPNLLELSKAVLPSEQLQVHYRSQFRELITFSNAGFYAGTLNVPVRHPVAEIDRHRPLDLVHVGGLYESRTNPTEADRVVDLLEQLWLSGTDEPPTTGVVTFNRDQADLIEQRLEQRAEENDAFRHAFIRETERQVNGEDMGFFVRNVENVQGDERDHILFSTTFGRNAAGTFRRNFGVLGQSGGERRLNVAITRARQRITIFTSMPIGEIAEVLGSGAPPSQPRDYLQLYLAYADALSKGEHEHAAKLLSQLGRRRDERARTREEPRGDALVQSVAAAIEDLGWTAVRAGDGSAFGIDLAIPHPEHGGFGIGIECNAADHVLLRRAHAREVWRPSVMRRSLPAIHRISGRNWYHQREEEIARLRKAVETAMR